MNCGIPGFLPALLKMRRPYFCWEMRRPRVVEKFDANPSKQYIKSMSKKRVRSPILSCPVCLSDRLDSISERMKKCLSCGFIWNHEVSDRDNLLLIVEHQARVEKERAPAVVTAPPHPRKRR